MKSEGFGKFARWSLALIVLVVSGCAGYSQPLLTADPDGGDGGQSYLIGAGDVLQIFVWGNQDLSATIPVRPDGRITTPLVEDVNASGKTSTQLARDIEERLKHYIKNPVVTVVVSQFVGRYSEQIRVAGEVATPQTLPYRERMTLLDVVIAVGGMTEYAAGNRATVARIVDGRYQQFGVRLDDLLKFGDLSANVAMRPGDVIFVPEAWF
jgi:polysaccharide export outer membrane protein